MNHTPQDPMQHPDELQLVAWSEGGLLDFEREPIDAHLAGCKACRVLVAELELEVDGATEAEPEPPLLFMDREWDRGGWRRGWSIALAVASFLLLATLVPRWMRKDEQLGRIEVAVASSSEDLFQIQRGAGATSSEFYVGVRLLVPSRIRLVAFDTNGEMMEIPLDPSGTVSASFAGARDHSFGPYPVQLADGVRVRTVFALVSEQRIEWGSVQAVDGFADGSLGPDAAALSWIEQQLDCQVAATYVGS